MASESSKGDFRNSRINHQINTVRLYLRPVDETDRGDFIALLSDPKVMRFVGINTGYIPHCKEISQLLVGAINVWKTRGYGRWSMFEKTGGEFVGFCGFRTEKELPELIVALHEKYWNQGLATEAAAECLNYGYKNLGFTEVKAYTHPKNVRARRLLEKLRGHFEGFTDFHGITGAVYSFHQPLTNLIS